LKYSEGKVSLMIADLERRELVEKFKRGRGNIIIMKDEER
ncbi:MAG: MarR family transcriptional regulator, partial [Alphaproteobacteria bacterium]